MRDLTDPAVRAEVTARLADPWRGRPVVVGPGVLAGTTEPVGWFRDLGCPVLVLATARGAGAVPADDACTVVDVAMPATATVTEELRLVDRTARELPDDVRREIERFDPERAGFWFGSPFLTDDEPIDGRPVGFGRPAAFLALEDKMLADGIWDAAGVARAPYRLVPVDDAFLDDATDALAGELGAVWVGDAREGYNGLGEFVRWVRTEDDRRRAAAFFKPRCDRVRVMPFLDGVPCSVHGIVLPDGTAAFRPVEIVVLRRPSDRTLVYAGLGSTWDPPDDDREEMRAVVRRVGEHLRERHGYRGAFGIDGVLTGSGFRPTELNSRMSAGLTLIAGIDRPFFTLLQMALLRGDDPGIGVAELEGLVPLMDAHRAGKVTTFAPGTTLGHDDSYPVAWDGAAFSRTASETGNVLAVGDTPTGIFAKVDPCALLGPGLRLAEVNAGLLAHLDATYGTTFGAVEPAPDLAARG